MKLSDNSVIKAMKATAAVLSVVLPFSYAVTKNKEVSANSVTGPGVNTRAIRTADTAKTFRTCPRDIGLHR